MNAKNPSQVKEQMSSLFDNLLEEARQEGRNEALSQFLKSVRNLSETVEALIKETENSLQEEEEESEEGPNGEGKTLSPRALKALDFLLDEKEVTVKALETHLNCSNASANLALNELVKTGRASKDFETGRAVFRPIRLSKVA